jgi:hypothetical protein
VKTKRWLSLLTAAVLLAGAAAGPVVRGEEAAGEAAGDIAATGEPVSISFDYPSEEAMLADMTLAAQNSRYALYVQASSMAVALLDKATGKAAFSNPYDAARDSSFNGDTEKNLESQLVLTYVDDKNEQSRLWSSADCAELGQFRAEETAAGVRFQLSIGKEAVDFQIPAAFTVERFEELTGRMSGRAKRKMNVFYTRYSLADITDEAERKKMIDTYPPLANEDLYVCIDLSEREKEELSGYLEEAGYSAADYQADSAKLNIREEEETTYSPNFKLTLEYTLTDEGLEVTIPSASIQYDKKHFTLISIQLLEYFGADKPGDASDGYVFLPDGSGALLSMNNPDENRRPVISGNVYGRDAATTQKVDERSGQIFHLPVYGIRRNNQSALFAIIDSGAEVSTISAKLGKPNSDYYEVFNTFYLTTSERVTLDAKVASIGSAQQVYVYDANAYKQDLRVRYTLLTGGEATYSGMARVYRDYLLAHGMRERPESNTVRLGLETLGTSLYATSFLGIEYQASADYTTYAQSEEMARYFLENGASRLSLTLTGWQKNGLDAGVANKVRLAGSLGGKKGLASLRDWAKGSNVALLPDVDLLFVARDTLFDGFSKSFDSGRKLNKKYAGNSIYRPDISQFGKTAFAVSPHKYASYWASFFKGYQKLGLSAVSLGTVGTSLNSNFDSSHAYNRGDTLALLQKQLDTLSGTYSLSFDGGNAYVLPYASNLNRVPIRHSGYTGETSAVPFLQLAVAGAMTCQSASLNLDEDIQTALLGCIESRTSPSFVLAADHVQRLKTTEHTAYYAVSYPVLKETVLEQYRYVQEALEAVEGQVMTDHAVLAPDVSRTVYSGGTKIYVNYNQAAYTADGLTVPAGGYAVQR